MWLPRHELVQDDTESVHIRAFRDGGARSKLLGRHVAECPDHHVGFGVTRCDGNTEVRNADPSILIDQDVGRLEVAMKNALSMSSRQSRTQLVGDFDYALGRQTARALEQGREILSVHELHREEDRLACFPNIEDPAHRRMSDLPCESYLAEDAAAV